VPADDTMKVRSSPMEITREIAESRLQFVRELIETIRAHL